MEGFTFDASRSNAIYGASTTVQPPATEMYLYFCAGEYLQDDVTTMKSIVAGAIESKADKGYAFPDWDYCKTIKGHGVAYDPNGYTAESDGWFSIDIHGTAESTSILIYLGGFHQFWMSNPGNYQPYYFPVRKGEKLTMGYDSDAGMKDGRQGCAIYFFPAVAAPPTTDKDAMDELKAYIDSKITQHAPIPNWSEESRIEMKALTADYNTDGYTAPTNGVFLVTPSLSTWVEITASIGFSVYINDVFISSAVAVQYGTSWTYDDQQTITVTVAKNDKLTLNASTTYDGRKECIISFVPFRNN